MDDNLAFVDDLVIEDSNATPPDPEAKILDPSPEIAGGGDFAG